MNSIRWSEHAIQNLVEREIDRSEVEVTLVNPGLVVPDPPGREVLMRRYFDGVLQQEMLMRVIVEHSQAETVVVTVYRTSQIERYWKAGQP